MGLLDFAKKFADTIGLDGHFGYQGTWTPPEQQQQPTPQQRQIGADIGARAGYGPAPNPAQNALIQAAKSPTPTLPAAPAAPTPYKPAPPPIEVPKFNMPLNIAGEFAKGVGQSLADIAHGVAQVPVKLALEGADILDPNSTHTFQAQDPVRKFIFGDDPVTSYQDQAEQFKLYLLEHGVSDNTAGLATIPAAGGLAAIDLFTGGKGKVAKEALAKATTDVAVKKILDKELGKSAEAIPIDVIKQLTAETDPAKINQILKAGPAGQERKFVSSVKGSPEVSKEAGDLVQGAYTPKANEDLVARALERVNSGKAAEFLDGATNRIGQLDTTKADEVVATTIELAKRLDGTGDKLGAAKLYSEIAEKLTDLGRGVQAASLLARQTPEGQLFQAERAFNKAKIEPTPEVRQQLAGVADIMREADGRRAAAEKIVASSPDTATLQTAAKARDAAEVDYKRAQYQMGRIVSEALPAERIDQLTSTWKAGLLSATTTLEGAGVGNVVKQGANAARDVLAAGIDATITNPILRALGKGNVRSNTLSGAVSGRLEGLGEGAKKSAEYLKTGFDERNIDATRDAVPATFKAKGAGWLGRAYQNAVFRPLGAVDQPFFYGELRKSMKEQANLAARNSGLKGADRQDFVRRFLSDPPVEAVSRAQLEAEDATFTNPTMLGKVAAAAKRAAGDNPVGKALAELILPFARIPSAVATAVVTYSPVGAVKEVVTQLARKELDPRALNRALADSTIGTAGAMFLGSKLYDAGVFTLATPQDANEKQLWEMEGKKPYSVLVGDKWISLNYIQPFGSLMAMGAAYDQAKKDGKPLTGAIAASAAAGGQAVTQQSFLKGVAGAIAALSTPERSAQQFVENTAGSVVPNELKRIAAAGDTNDEGLVNSRETNGIGDAIKAGIPGARETLPQSLGADGQPLNTGQTAAGTLLDPLKSSQAKGGDDALIGELQRLQDAQQGITPTKQDANLTLGGEKLKLTPEQLIDYKGKIGTAVTDLWRQIALSPGYTELDDAGKRQALDRAKSAVTAATNAQFAQDNKLGDPQKALSDVNGLAASVLAGTATPDMFTTDSSLLDQATKVQMLKDTYAADKAAGKLTPVEDFKRRKAIASAEEKVGQPTTAQIAAKYSKDAVALASLSKKDLATMVAGGGVSQQLVDEMTKYKAELASSKPAKASSRKGRAPAIRKGSSSVKGARVKLPKTKAPKLAKVKTKVTTIKPKKVAKVKLPHAKLA